MLRELKFCKDGKEYLAQWNDLVKLYEEDKNDPIRLTKLTYNGYPKPLQRPSVPLVHQTFNEKTIAALSALQSKLNIQEGTIILVELISNWFKMMHVKDTFSCQKLKDNLRAPWSAESENFAKLQKICDVIATCTSKAEKGSGKKLTRFTGRAFVVTTKSAIESC